MKTLARITLVLFFSHLFILSVAAQSRPNDAVVATGTVSGRVTVRGRPLAGLAIGLQPYTTSSMSIDRARTDGEGRYQFTRVTAGSYEINALNLLYVLAGDNYHGVRGITVTISEGENRANVDLALIRGSVVTGRITDPEGRPIIGQFVQLDRLTPANALSELLDTVHTDDCGIYRALGVPPGKYLVSAGEDEELIGQTPGRKSYPRTFHPDVTQVSQATIIEVAEGSEVTGIDIRLSLALKTYTIAGRAVDAETNEPVTNVTIVAGRMHPDGQLEGYPGRLVFGSGGEFRIEELRPGRYGVYAGNTSLRESSNYGYSGVVPTEVIDRDVTGVEIRVKPGGAISGVAVVEGGTDPAILTRLTKLWIVVGIRQPERDRVLGWHGVQIAGDGTFHVEGVRPGMAKFQDMRSTTAFGLTLLGIDREGVLVDGIEIGPGEQVTGVRLVFAYANGIVRGQVILTGGSLPEGSRFSVSARRSDDSHEKSASTDAKGTFAIEGLPPGQYELEARPIIRGSIPLETRRRATSAQTVTVTNGRTSEVTFTIDLSQKQ